MNRYRKLLITVACAAGLAAANLIAAWCLPERWDLTRQGNYTLSIETRQLLQNLEAPVEITILASPRVRIVADREVVVARALLEDLLEQYRRRSERVTIREIDPASGAEGRQLQQQYPDATAPCLVITYGKDDSQRHEVLSLRELLRVRSGTEQQAGRIEFLGEQAITASLKRISVGRKQTIVYVLEGHGGLSLSRTDPATSSGLSRLAARLHEVDCELRPLDLRESDIPKDADLLLLAGLDLPFLSEELQKVGSWLANGGRALLLFDLMFDPVTKQVQKSGWEELLEEYDLEIGNDCVQSRSFSGRIERASLGQPTADNHQLVRALPTSPITLFGCRTVRQMNSVRQRPVSLTALLASYKAPHSWAAVDIRSGSPDRPMGPKDIPGPVSMAFAVERLAGIGGASRPVMVVVGDSEFASNMALADPASQPGFQFILSSINWLRGRHDLMADIKPHVRSAYRLPGDEVAHRRLVWLPMLFLVATFTTAGTTVWLIRRNG